MQPLRRFYHSPLFYRSSLVDFMEELYGVGGSQEHALQQQSEADDRAIVRSNRAAAVARYSERLLNDQVVAQRSIFALNEVLNLPRAARGDYWRMEALRRATFASQTHASLACTLELVCWPLEEATGRLSGISHFPNFLTHPCCL
jgi:hypothetical protein